MLFDRDQRIVLFNRRFKSLWTRTRARINAGTRLAEVRRLAESTGLIVEEHRGKGDEPTVYRLNSGRWVQVSERPTREGGLVILYTDITEVKVSETMRREQALAQKSRLLQRAVDNLSQGVAMVSVEGALELWNRRFLELCGLAPIEAHRPFEEVMADSELNLLTPNSRDARGRPIRELEQRLFDGRMLEIRTHPLPTGGFVNTFTDITERYRHAEALRESERWIRRHMVGDRLRLGRSHLRVHQQGLRGMVSLAQRLAEHAVAGPVAARGPQRRALAATGALH